MTKIVKFTKAEVQNMIFILQKNQYPVGIKKKDKDRYAKYLTNFKVDEGGNLCITEDKNSYLIYAHHFTLDQKQKIIFE